MFFLLIVMQKSHNDAPVHKDEIFFSDEHHYGRYLPNYFFCPRSLHFQRGSSVFQRRSRRRIRIYCRYGSVQRCACNSQADSIDIKYYRFSRCYDLLRSFRAFHLAALLAICLNICSRQLFWRLYQFTAIFLQTPCWDYTAPFSLLSVLSQTATPIGHCHAPARAGDGTFYRLFSGLFIRIDWRRRRYIPQSTVAYDELGKSQGSCRSVCAIYHGQFCCGSGWSYKQHSKPPAFCTVFSNGCCSGRCCRFPAWKPSFTDNDNCKGLVRCPDYCWSKIDTHLK